jgi:hypothetical protein
MPDLAYAERLYAEAELSFARWIAGLDGWVHRDTVQGGNASYAQIAENWLHAGLIRETTKNFGRTEVVELTDAGRAWCRDNGSR